MRGEGGGDDGGVGGDVVRLSVSRWSRTGLLTEH